MSESNGHAVGTLETTKRLSVADILAANDIREEDVEVPEWGGSVRIRGFTKQRQQELRQMATDPKNGQVDAGRLELQIFIHGVIDPQFAPIQMTELRGKSAGAIDRVLQRIMDISGMTREAIVEAEKSVPDEP
jgi:hypothetical protein